MNATLRSPAVEDEPIAVAVSLVRTHHVIEKSPCVQASTSSSVDTHHHDDMDLRRMP